MSRRNNNVRGPTSALTEFLRDSGITPTTIAARAATRTQPQAQDQQVAGPSTLPTVQSSTSREQRSTLASGYASDDLDAEEQADNAMDVDEEAQEASPPKKQKLSKAAQAKLKAKEKKKQGKNDENDDYEEEDAYTALSKSLWTSSASRPRVGNFEKCAVCEKQFTVTKYTMASSSGEGYLCHQCAKAGGIDPFKKPTTAKKRKAPSEKRNVTSFEERRFPTLVSLCVQLITDHIDDVEALGDIGALNIEAIARALSRNRSLTPQNAHLFYNSANKSLTLFDATNLDSPALETLAFHNANLVSLRLDFCGQLTDDSLKVWCTSFPALTRIELLGPFLVHSNAWEEFFKHHPSLEGFLITQSPRFDLGCMRTLVKHCPGIKELRLREVGKLNDAFLVEIGKLKRGLWYLDLSEPSESCSESAMLRLIAMINKTVTHLSLADHDLLTDNFLTQGLQAHVKHLESLTLPHLPELTDPGVGDFFRNWNNPPLASLDMSRNDCLGSSALKAILKHSGSRLEHLNINGWKDVGEPELKLIGRAKELKKLDVGWCRAVDDFVVKGWLEGESVKSGVVKGGCRRLEEIKVWGCNKLTAACPRRKGVSVLGVESHTVY